MVVFANEDVHAKRNSPEHERISPLVATDRTFMALQFCSVKVFPSNDLANSIP